MKEWKKEAANASLPLAQKDARRGLARLQRPYQHPDDMSGHGFRRAANTAYPAHPSDSSSTRTALADPGETLQGCLKSVSVRKDPHPLFSITYGWF